MTDEQKKSPLHSPVGAEGDVEATAESINPREITATTMAEDSAETRADWLRQMIGELEARVAASDRGQDLEPLLHEARAALRIVEGQAEGGAPE